MRVRHPGVAATHIVSGMSESTVSRTVAAPHGALSVRVEPSVCASSLQSARRPRRRKPIAPSGPCAGSRRRGPALLLCTCARQHPPSPHPQRASLARVGRRQDYPSVRRGPRYATQESMKVLRLQPTTMLAPARGAQPPPRSGSPHCCWHIATNRTCHLQEVVGEPRSRMETENKGPKRQRQTSRTASAAAGSSKDGQCVLKQQRSN